MVWARCTYFIFELLVTCQRSCEGMYNKLSRGQNIGKWNVTKSLAELTSSNMWLSSDAWTCFSFQIDSSKPRIWSGKIENCSQTQPALHIWTFHLTESWICLFMVYFLGGDLCALQLCPHLFKVHIYGSLSRRSGVCATCEANNFCTRFEILKARKVPLFSIILNQELSRGSLDHQTACEFAFGRRDSSSLQTFIGNIIRLLRQCPTNPFILHFLRKQFLPCFKRLAPNRETWKQSAKINYRCMYQSPSAKNIHATPGNWILTWLISFGVPVILFWQIKLPSINFHLANTSIEHL